MERYKLGQVGRWGGGEVGVVDGGKQRWAIYIIGSQLRLTSLSSTLPSLRSGVGLMGERVPLLLSMASSTLRSEYSPSPSTSNETSGVTEEGGGLVGF